MEQGVRFRPKCYSLRRHDALSLSPGVGHMRRREFITVLGGAAVAWPLAARAQQKDRVRRIGALMLTAEKDPLSRERRAAFEQGLAKLGWTIDRGVQIDYRWDVATPERAATVTAELLRLTPDLILAN